MANHSSLLEEKSVDSQTTLDRLIYTSTGPSELSSKWKAFSWKNWSIGRKIVLVVCSLVTLSYAVLLTEQLSFTWKHEFEHASQKDLHITNLLANQISSAVRWKKKDAAERKYEFLIEGPSAPISNIVVLDVHDNVLSLVNRPESELEDISSLSPLALDALQKDALFNQVTDTHSIYFVPVVSGAEGLRVGTLGIAWSLSKVRERVEFLVLRQTSIGAFIVVAISIILVISLHKIITGPLTTLSNITLRIAEGITFDEIPSLGRHDEIGDMARSLNVFQQNRVSLDKLSAEQVVQNERLQEALEKEREYSTLQAEFVAMASHEFRTPLTVIDASARRLQKNWARMSEDQIGEKTSNIRSSVVRMTQLVDSVLSSSKLNAGKLKVEQGEFDLVALLIDICSRQQMVSPNHSIDLSNAANIQSIVGDSRLLDQVFTNLLSNAVKYAPNAPKVEVHFGVEGDMVQISVRDYGLGIPEEEQEKVFERYFRASTSTGIAGTGIGLNLVAQIVEQHGGRIDLHSVAGEGSTFTVTLPIDGNSR